MVVVNMDNNLIDLRDVYKPTPFMGSPLLVSLRDLRRQLEFDGVDISPPYQRGSVWTAEQRSAFMGHLLSGGEVLPVVIQRIPESETSEVLDGKQRIEACLGWLDNEVEALLPDGRNIKYADCVRLLNKWPAGLSKVHLVFRYVNLPWDERVRFYVRLNSAGTPHTPEQLAAAIAARPRQ